MPSCRCPRCCDDPCQCPFTKLVGYNFDPSLDYLSPKARVKCKDLCPPCYKCQNTRGIVIRPGDGTCFLEFGSAMRESINSGWIPPYDFGGNPHQRNPLCSGNQIFRGHCSYPQKDYIEANAVGACQAVPKIPVPRIVVDNRGNTNDWCKSGFARNGILKNTYGTVPVYTCGVKERLAKEDYRMRCVLTKLGDICDEEEDNRMNKIGLLGMQYSKSPLVHQSRFYIKPRADDMAAKLTPHNCFLPF